MQRRRDAAAVGIEVGVARRQRETVLLAHRGHPDDADAEIEVGDQPLDHLQLLVILLPEISPVRRAVREQPRDHGRDAVEMPGPNRAAQPLPEFGGRDRDRRPPGIHLLHRRRIDDVDAVLPEQPQIALLVPRIPLEVLACAELRGVYEQAGDHDAAFPARPAHQREMTVVQRPHGGNQPDGALGSGRSESLFETRRGARDRRHRTVRR